MFSIMAFFTFYLLFIYRSKSKIHEEFKMHFIFLLFGSYICISFQTIQYFNIYGIIENFCTFLDWKRAFTTNYQSYGRIISIHRTVNEPIVQNAQMSNLVLFISSTIFVRSLYRNNSEIYNCCKFLINHIQFPFHILSKNFCTQ